MNYHVLENMVNVVYFCKDGKLRTHVSSKVKKPEQEIAPAIDIQNELLADEFQKRSFFYTLINRNVIFEKDLTFGEFVDCLKPWEKEISVLLAKNAGSFFDSVSDNGKFDPEKNYVQIMNVSMLSKRMLKKPSDVKPDLSRHLDIVGLLHRSEQEWDGNYIEHEEKNSFSVVNFDHNSDIMWRTIYDGFEGLKNLKLHYLSDMFYFIFDEKNGKNNDSELIKSEGSSFNKYNIVKVKEREMPTINELLIGLFAGTAEVYSPVSNVQLEILPKEKINPEKLDKTIQIYVKETLAISKSIEPAIKKINNINFTKIEKFSFEFGYNGCSIESFTVYNARFKLTK